MAFINNRINKTTMRENIEIINLCAIFLHTDKEGLSPEYATFNMILDCLFCILPLVLISFIINDVQNDRKIKKGHIFYLVMDICYILFVIRF